jgi:endonuclease V-like protein UPF0215 family
MLKTIKPEIRIIGWDDAPFLFTDKYTMIVGVICRGGLQIDGLLTSKIRIDGNDVTEKMAMTINKSKHKQQLRVIMLDGITFGGFNIVDIQELNKKTNLPVIVIIRERPSLKAIKKCLSRFSDANERLLKLEKAGKIKKLEIKNKVLKGRKTIYYQCYGIDKNTCENIIKLTAVNSLVPEPIRVAHIICNGLKGVKKI